MCNNQICLGRDVRRCKTFFCRLLVAFLALVFAGVLPIFAQSGSNTESSECELLAFEGKVLFALKDNTSWAPAHTNLVLHPGDRIRVGLRSRATLRWSDLSVMRVDELTTLELQAPSKPGAKPELNLQSGAAYFFSREKPSDIQFHTPVASGAIRGTEFNLAVADGGATLLTLLDGAVDLSNNQGAVTLASGEQASVAAGEAPRKTAVIDARRAIQWALYYPQVVSAADLKLSDNAANALTNSLTEYRLGNLLGALNDYPEGRQPDSDAEKVFHAALLLSVGQVDPAQAEISGLETNLPPAAALREMVAVAQNQKIETNNPPQDASQWMARSYTRQANSQLKGALDAARMATVTDPLFGAAWIRCAELEFGLGQRQNALADLDHGLTLSPQNAEGVTLRGFIEAAANRPAAARASFDQAIALDGGLGKAWLGRGLMKMYAGKAREGRQDLQVAATLEPNRSLFRSYLGKAFTQTWDPKHAAREFGLARQLDPGDPTPYLYSALLEEQENEINQAIRDLEKSKDLNDNRSLFRSRLLLDQDQAVRRANLASMYRDAGMLEVSQQEAERAIEQDYGNFSAHLFLANSFDALRDPQGINLRYETPWFSELLLANLLSPVSGGNLSSSVSQEEYSRLFEGDHLGIFSSTEYSSRGDWAQTGSQYGVIGDTGYAVDSFYRSANGYRPNNDLDQLSFSARVKEQLTADDSVYLEASTLNAHSGDLAQYYAQSNASPDLRVSERQTPNLLLGYHHEWAPGNHTLLLLGRLDDTLRLKTTNASVYYYQQYYSPFPPNPLLSSFGNPFGGEELDYYSQLTAYSAELQQIFETEPQTLVFGGRYQVGWPESSSTLINNAYNPGSPIVVSPDQKSRLERGDVYAYETVRLWDQLALTAGVAYDHLEYPSNMDAPPIIGGTRSKDMVSPKAGIVWSPLRDTQVRGVYTRSLGGVYFDNSVRLEPTQIAGFNQAFRSLLPESIAGLVPGTEFTTWGAGLDQKFDTGTYLTIEGQWLKSEGDRDIGLLANSSQFPLIAPPQPNTAATSDQTLQYKEDSLLVSVNQLLSQEFSIGARYRFTKSYLTTDLSNIPANLSGVQNNYAILNQLDLFANFYHPCGAFAEVDGIWNSQSNHGYNGSEPGDDFWQWNVYVGYRMWMRHLEARLGILNLTDRDYQLDPLTPYLELPRERTFTASLKWYF